MRLRCGNVRREKQERPRKRSARERSMRGSAPRWRRLRGRRWQRSGRWRSGLRESAMSAGMRVVVAEEEAGGMIARLEEMKVEEAAGVDGGTIALLLGEAHLQDEEAHHTVHLQGGEALLRKGLASSWHRGPSEVHVEVVEVAGESVRGRKRNLGVLEAGTEIVPPGVTRLPGGV